MWHLAVRKSRAAGVVTCCSSPPPTYQPPASVAVKRNGWYFRRGALVSFFSLHFLFQRVKQHCRAGMWQSQVSIQVQLPRNAAALFDHLDHEEMFLTHTSVFGLQILAVVDHFF